MDTIVERYEKKFSKSGELYQRGTEVVGGGRTRVSGNAPLPGVHEERQGRAEMGSRR